MTMEKAEFDRLIHEAWQHEFSGWDFNFVSGRMVETPPAWDYRAIVLEKIRNVKSLLDLDTGGGEFLAGLQPIPPETCATEGFPPNVPVAKARLEPLGVKVFDTHATTQLPLPDAAFELVINRHGGMLPVEILRVLKSGGTFITQQVGGRNCIQLNESLGAPPDFLSSAWSMDAAARQLEGAGLKVIRREEDFPKAEFKDIGAVVYYLKAIPWQIDDFSIEKYYDRLMEISERIQREGAFAVKEHRFFLEAQKP
jgi:SAM-dependent methyltransferase